MESWKGNSRNILILKGTTRGLSGVFLPLVMNPLCPLKYYDRSMVNITHLYGKNRSGGSVMLAGPLVVPLSCKPPLLDNDQRRAGRDE